MKKNRLFAGIVLGVSCLLGLGVVSVASASGLGDLSKAEAAIGNNQLFVAGIDINTQPNKKIGDDEHYVQLSGTTLTFNNYTYEGNGYFWETTSGTNTFYHRAGVAYFGTENLTFNIVGENSITVSTSATPSVSSSYGLLFSPGTVASRDDEALSKNLTFTGTGKITFTAGYGSNPYGFRPFTIGTVNFNGPYCVFKCPTSDTRDDDCWGLGGGPIPSSGNGRAAIRLNSGTLEVDGGNMRATGSFGSSIGISAQDYIQSGGTLIAKSGQAAWRRIAFWASSLYASKYPKFNGGKVIITSEYGSAITASTSTYFTIGSGLESFSAVGAEYAFNGGVRYNDINKMALGWTDTAGTGYGTKIPAKTAISDTYKKVFFGIQDTSTNTEVLYDTDPHSASISTSTEDCTIEYSTDDSSYSSVAPTFTNLGTYTVYYKISHATFPTVKDAVTLTINPNTPTVTLPTAKNPYCTGDPQDLLNPGSSEDGTFYYRLGTSGDWNTSVPQATAIGTYDTYYKFTANPGYSDIEPTLLQTSILQPEVTNPEVEVTGEYHYTGSPLTPTVNATAVTVKSVPYTFTYSATNGGPYGAMPSFTEIGNHTIYYEVNAEGHIPAHGSFVFTILNAELIDVSVTVEAGTFNYDGHPKTPVVETSGRTASGEPATFSYSLSPSGAYGKMPSFTNAGDYVVYWKAEAPDYETETGHFEVHINKVDGSIKSAPVAKKGLKYSGTFQQLIKGGETEDGVIKYKLGESGEYSSSIPTAKEVGDYVIYYKLFGDGNHNDSAEQSLSVSIGAVDKTELNKLIKEAYTYSKSIKDRYPSIAELLDLYIKYAQDVYDDEDATQPQVDKVYKSLKNALLNARVDDVKDKIDNIGEVTYPGSKGKITEARTSYDALPEDEKPYVPNYQTLVDAEETYNRLEDNALRQKIEDNPSGTSIETTDGIGIPRNVDLRVEVRTDVKAEKGTVERTKINAMLGNNEKISDVYDVKLIQTVGGVEKEIQPSDIEKGLIIKVHISVPKGVNVDSLRILHIHSENDMEFIDNFFVEGDEIIFEVDRLSEFAFVVPSGLPGWAIALIVIGSVLLLCCLALVALFLLLPRFIVNKDKNKVVRAISIRKKDGEVLLLSMHCKIERRPEAEVYKTKEEAEQALNK